MSHSSKDPADGGREEHSHVKQTLTESAYKLLKRLILEGKLQEGLFLSEKSILREYGMGRTPFREACNRLHHEELLEVVPRRGYMVRKMSFLQVRDFFELRLLIESIVAELAAVRATPERIDELAQLANPEIAGEDQDKRFGQIIEANRRFHICLAQSTGNKELLKLVTRILEGSERISYIELRAARFQATDLAKYHLPLVEAIRNHDPLIARKAIVEDIANAQLSAFGRDFWMAERGSVLPVSVGSRETATQ